MNLFFIYFQDRGIFQAPCRDWWNSRGRGFDCADCLYLLLLLRLQEILYCVLLMKDMKRQLSCLLLQAGWIKTNTRGVVSILLICSHRDVF